MAFDDSTSNQVLVYITPTLYGEEVQSAAQQLGERWGVGHDGFNNGVVILIKSKTAEENWGEVAIATGYGVEGALPDVYCKHIIDNEMIASLGDGDYYGALKQALDVVEPAMKGEYSYARYRADERRKALLGLVPLLVIFIVAVVAIARYAKKHPDEWNSGGFGGGGGIYFGGTPEGFWSSRGGNFPSGGGFGGFGGGHFGGGGASGRF